MIIRNMKIRFRKCLVAARESAGYSEHRCVYCGGDVRRIGFSCKSCFCLYLRQKYVDDFVSQVSRVLHGGMNYRHIVLTIPEQLRIVFIRLEMMDVCYRLL